MGQPLYQLWTHDQSGFNWITCIPGRQGEWALRLRYVKLACKKCRGLALDEVFEDGFDSQIRITAKKGVNILTSEDAFLCVSDSILDGLKRAGVLGFAAKPLPETGWNALKITNRKPFDASAYQRGGVPCELCGRQGQYRILEFERQIVRPAEELTFCCTETERGQGGFDIFLSRRM